MLLRVLLPLALIVIAAFAVLSGLVHLTVGAIKILFGVLVVLLVISVVTGRRRAGPDGR